jgi:hypothetical protein
VPVFEKIRHDVAIAGAVTDAASGAPLAGATVTVESGPAAWTKWLAMQAVVAGARWEMLERRPDRLATDAAGRFVLIDLPAGTYRLRAQAPGPASRYATATASPRVTSGADGRPVLATADIALKPTRIRGVVTSGGKPLPMTQVTVVGSRETAWTGTDGSYELRPLETGARTLVVTAPGFTPARASVALATAGGVATKNFTLTAVSP